MENITKALLIAAGVLIAVMLLALVFVFWNEMSGYFTEKHNTAVLEQTVEFNNQFANYDKQTIRGNELISVMNRIINYNNYQSEMVGYERVKIEIDLKGHEADFKYNGETGSNSLFSGNIKNTSNDDSLKLIAETSSRLVNESLSGIPYLTDTKLQRLAARINDIVDDNISDSREKAQYKIDRATLLSKILGYTVAEDDAIIDDVKKATYQYHQFMQFKRAMFECKEVSYNQENGRVNGMKFEVITETDSMTGVEKIKFD